MAQDMKVWLGLVKDQVAWLADEEAQRRAWFGVGPEVDSPAETFNKFFSNAAVEDFVKLKNTGLHEHQLESLRSLMEMVDALCTETNEEIKTLPPAFELPPTFVDDPRWQKVIKAAKKTKGLLEMKTI